MRIVLKIENTQFRYFADAAVPFEDEIEGTIYVDLSEEKIGTVIYAAEVIDEYPDELLAWGSEDGVNYGICLHEPFKDFQDAWRKAVIAAKGSGVMTQEDRERTTRELLEG